MVSPTQAQTIKNVIPDAAFEEYGVLKDRGYLPAQFERHILTGKEFDALEGKASPCGMFEKIQLAQ
jgi:hypothetical protein